jgi:predicted DNA-binding ribbon-helix-helix protein
MKSSVIKRSIMIDGHKTSVSLENAFWEDLKEIAQTQQSTLSKLVAAIDKRRQHGNLSSAIRLFVLTHAMDTAKLSSARVVERSSTGQALHWTEAVADAPS